MSPSAPIFTVTDNPLVLTYVRCAILLCIKMLGMVFLTARQRLNKNVFANPEDAVKRGVKVKLDDPDVERVRRAHLNDLENIPTFLVVSFLYVTVGQTVHLPSVTLATGLLWAFTIARFIHTFVYAIVVLPQPARGLSFGVGFIVTIYMAVSILLRISALTA